MVLRRTLVTVVTLLVAVTAHAVCVTTAYNVLATPPPTANWTDATGALWTTPGGFPGCASGDSANIAPSSPTTIVVNSAIPNPVVVTEACAGCVIDVQPGGSITFAGASTIGGGATLQLSGGSVTIASGATLTIQSGGVLDVVNTTVIGGAGSFNVAGGSVSVSSGTLSIQTTGTGDGPFTTASGTTLDFATGASYTLTPNGTISGAGTLSITGGFLSIGGVTQPDGFVMTAGTLTGPGFLSVTRSMAWSGGTITGTGGAELAGTGTGSFDGTDGMMVLDQRTFNDYGQIYYTATANSLQLANGATFAIYGVFDILDDGSITCDCIVPPSLLIEPNGYLAKDGGAGTSVIHPPTTNDASVFVGSGNLEFAGNGIHSGLFFNVPGTAITFSAPSTTLDGCEFGDGLFAFINNSLTDVTGCYDVAATSIGSNASLRFFTDGATGDFTFDTGTLSVSNSTFTMYGTGTWSGGTIDNGGTFDVAPGAALTIDALDGDCVVAGSTFQNDGTVYYTAATGSVSTLAIRPRVVTSFALELRSGALANIGLFEIQGDAPINASILPSSPALKPKSRSSLLLGGSIIDNSGTFQKVSTGTTDIYPTFTTSGDVKAQAGVMHFVSTYTQTDGTTSLAGGDISVDLGMQLSGGTLEGAGTVTGAVTNDATVNPGSGTTPGTITITGAYTQGSGGTLITDLAGDLSFDQLATGSATLDGTFTANLVGAYAPANGTAFDVVSFSTRSGDFAVKNLPTWPNGSFTDSYTPFTFRLTAVVIPTADVSIVKSGPAGVTSGQNVVYTLTITNNGPSAASSVVVSDPPPANLTWVSNSGGCTGAFPCSLGTLAPSQVVTITSTYSTSPSFGGNVSNTATVSTTTFDPNNTNDSSTASTNVGPQADLAIAKTGPASVTPGQNVVYTITVTNNGPSPATSVVVSDPTPTGLAFQSNTGACASAYPCNLGTLAAGGSAVITSTYTVPNNYTGASIVNTASVSSTVNDPSTLDNTSMATTPVTQQADLSINKSGPGTTSQGQLITYTITVSNLGPSAVSSVVVSDPTPAGLLFVSNSGACTSAFPCNLGTLNSGATATITSTYTVPPNYAGASITNTASVSSSAVSDPNGSNNSSSVTTAVIAQADLSIAKSGPPTFVRGQTITFTVTVTNNGPLASTNTFVTDTTPAGLTFVSNSGACTGPYPCALGTLASGQSVTITSIYDVPAGYGPSTISNTASVSSSTPDVNNTNDSATATSAAATSSNTELSITKTGPATATSGSLINFTIAVTNNGPATATNVTISDPTPSGLVFMGNTGACTSGFPCTIASMTAGQTISFTSQYVVNAPFGSNITNTASVASGGNDPLQGNNSSSATVTVATTGTCPSAAPVQLTPADGASTGSPVAFSWRTVTSALTYRLTINGVDKPVVVETVAPNATVTLPNGRYAWSVEAIGTAGCRGVSSGVFLLNVCSAPAGAPVASVVGEATTGHTYVVQWNAITDGTSFELQESTEPSFNNPTTFALTARSKPFVKVAASPVPFFYRVRAISSCGLAGPYSPVVAVVIVPVPDARSGDPNINIPAGSKEPVTFPIFVPGQPNITTTFVATVDKPWLSVVPTSGIVGPDGVTLMITADPNGLPNGTWTGTVIVIYGTAGVVGPTTTAATAPTITIPVSVNLVTPVTPTPPSGTPDSAMLIPSVGHLAGIDSFWRSDVRLANVGGAPRQFFVTFNAGSGDPSAALKQTTINVDAGATVALDDLVRNWYGIGSLNDSSNGVLQIVPLDASGKPSSPDVNKVTPVSSRTYSTSSAGTLGQFIGAVPLSAFIGRGSAILSLQQIAQSDIYRTNLGVVEGAGKDAQVLVSVFDAAGAKLLELPLSLKAGEQRQLNGFLADNHIALTNGRIEVQVVGGSGKVTAYASVVDRRTDDPLLVSGVPLGGRNTRFVVPGVADLNTGSASWRSDLRLFNAGPSPQSATLTFYPEGNPSGAVTRDVTIAPNEIKALDNILQALFGAANVGGALHVTTPAAAPLVVTARTFDQTPGGTVGQFIPAVTPADAVGLNDRSLNILQAEESSRYRTNLGIAEVSGKPAIAEITVILPDSKVAPVIQLPLAANEFRQLPIISSLGIGSVYNARISIRVIDGDGRVTAYGSMIDRKSGDPTFVPGL